MGTLPASEHISACSSDSMAPSSSPPSGSGCRSPSDRRAPGCGRRRL